MKLGKAKWKDPERRASIDTKHSARLRWKLSFKTLLSRRVCWPPLPPAQETLLEPWERIEGLVSTRELDFWRGEKTASCGCSWERWMYGSSTKNAQPTILFCSSSKKCRSNAAVIIESESIEVDVRGVGLEFYESGPVFRSSLQLIEPPRQQQVLPVSFAQSPRSSTYVPLHAFHQAGSAPPPIDIQDVDPRPTVGGPISTEYASCTMGGVIYIDGKLYGLTVGHAFELNPSSEHQFSAALNDESPISIKQGGIIIGSLIKKNASNDRRSLDWAVCTIDPAVVCIIRNHIVTPSGFKLFPRQIATSISFNVTVWVKTKTIQSVKGLLLKDYSLVALPGRRAFQRLWMVVLEREIQPGDCGAWVIGADGMLYGHIVSSRPKTTVSYIMLARDLFRDIGREFDGDVVSLPPLSALEEACLPRPPQDAGASNERGPWCGMPFFSRR